MRKTLISFSSSAEIRTFFSLAWREARYNNTGELERGRDLLGTDLFTFHVWEKLCVENNPECSHCSHH